MNILTRNKTTLLIKAAALSISSLLPLQVHASDAIGPGDSDSKWILGASAVVFNDPYSDQGGTVGFGPNLTYNGERFFITDNSLNLHIAKSSGFSGGLKLALSDSLLGDRSDYRDNQELDGLIERQTTVLGGVYLNYDTDLGRLSFSALSDLGNEHDGELANLEYTFDLEVDNWNINPSLGVEWVSDEFVNHHVGVSMSEVTASRTEYSGEATANAFAGIRARYNFNENWDINLNTGVTKLGSGITNSSIIEDDVVYSAGIGINYNF